jgi:hypothetical protein
MADDMHAIILADEKEVIKKREEEEAKTLAAARKRTRTSYLPLHLLLRHPLPSQLVSSEQSR